MMNLKLKEEIKVSLFFDNLIEDDLGVVGWKHG
jgi:hypothetical protein